MIFNLVLFLISITLFFIPCVIAGPGVVETSTPSYVVAIAVIIPLVLFCVILYFIIRIIRRRRLEKNRSSKPTTTTTTTTSTTIEQYNEKKITNHHHESIDIDRCCSEDSSSYPPPPLSPPTKYEDIKISLPLPPASTSLFSDKLELSSDEATELYKKYVNGDGVVPIEAQRHNNRFSTTIKKAATIRSTFRQSLKRQRSTKNMSSSSTTPLRELFDKPPSRQSSISNHSRSHPPTPGFMPPKTPDTPVTPLTPPPPLPTFSEKIALDDNYHYQQPTPTITQKMDDPIIPYHVPPTPTTPTVPDRLTRPSIDEYREEQEEKKELKEQQVQQEKKETKAAETEAHQIIQFASIRSKRRSFLTDLQNEQESSMTPSSSHSDFSRSSPSVRDIISWWQKEPSMKSSPSDHSLTPSISAPSQQQQQLTIPPVIPSFTSPVQNDVIQQAQETPKPTPPASIRGSTLSRQSSIKRPASSLFSANNESPRQSLGSLSRLSTAERMMIMGNSSINSNTSHMDSIRRSLQATWNTQGSDHGSNNSSTNSSIASRHQQQQQQQQQQQHHHLLSMRGQHHWQQRPAMPAGFMQDDMEGPIPTASFSSSTVRTMIPEGEYQEQTKQENNNNSTAKNNKKGTTVAIAQGSFSRSNPINQRQSVTLSPKTVPSSVKQKAAANTMRGGRKQQRGGIPWLNNTNDNNSNNSKTPAQREKDRYLQSLSKK